MTSRDGRWVLSYNGEIYNHLKLRAELSGPWQGHSDTETLVEAIATWGVETALNRVVGMFAFALWDSHKEVMWLARDRMGEKPLYYGMLGEQLRVGSELKALCSGMPRPEINRGALTLYLEHNYIPAPLTIWDGLWKLTAGHCLQVRKGMVPTFADSYSYCQQSEKLSPPIFLGSQGDAIEELDRLLRDAVHGQMMADVPLGAFLSGGIDSSLIVALMQSQSERPVQTFTIGFDEPDHDESGYAEAVARHLGTEHTTLYVTSADALAVVPELPHVWDEPFADSSQIPCLLLARLTRKHVKVSLTGDGRHPYTVAVAANPRHHAIDKIGHTRGFWATKTEVVC
jgi:asparagine synthase (glutamine-hydrolysing)